MLTASLPNSGLSLSASLPSKIARRAVADVIDAAQKLADSHEATAESVHALRRACRSAGVVLDLLAGTVDDEASIRLGKILKKLRRRAGRVRDLDVHVEIAADLLGVKGQPRRLHREIEEERPEHERALLEYVAKVTPGRLRKLRARLRREDGGETRAVRNAVAKRAARWIARANKVLSHPLPEDRALHELRIDLKKLRISLKTLRDLGAKGTVRKEEIIAAAARHLGRFHDVATLRERLEARPDASEADLLPLLRKLRAEEANAVVLARNSLKRLQAG